MDHDSIALALAALTRDYYTAKEAAEALGMTAPALANWASRGKMQPDYRVGEGKGSLAFYDKTRIINLANALAAANVK